MDNEILEFPFEFEMDLPEFGTRQEDVDGYVLYLDELLTSESNVVVLKNFADSDLVQLLVSSPVIDNGVVASTNDTSIVEPALLGYHFYSFPNDVTVYAEQALHILPLT